jgi:hypothetical protein
MSDHPSMASLGEANRVLLSPWTTPVSRLVLDPQHDQEILQAMATRGLLPPFAEMPAVLFVGAPGDTWTTARSEAPKVPADLDKHGPIPLAVAAVYESNPASARQGEQARIIVWGSRAAASNGVLVRNEFANADLSVDLARWLSNRGKANPIPASEGAAFTVTATDNGMWVVTALLIALMPCLAIGAAILSWLHRR